MTRAEPMATAEDVKLHLFSPLYVFDKSPDQKVRCDFIDWLYENGYTITRPSTDA